eukprot:TRINITY_DN3617_c0_g1_i2.p1 TRINITY_DN3617_c0_g1~~TRINITY_DN3617_c0_g1_i2.p1  ORF type:complete len:735 (-),score=339.57 TRINITY_DN3617_c0_g1_i2:93-2297(-)
MSNLAAWFLGLSNQQKGAVVAAAATAGYVASKLLAKPHHHHHKDKKDKKEGGKGKKSSNYTELWRRLKQIFKIILPSFVSREFAHLLALSGFLVARTLLSIKVAETTGRVASFLVQAQWEKFVVGVVYFAFLGVPAAFVNSGLKYETNMLALCFRRRLTEYVNSRYIHGVNFYKATNLPQCHIEHVDQRVTADIDHFCTELSNLYTSIFKPVLDVILNTVRLSSVMGVRGPMLLVLYYLVLGQVRMRLMPNFKKLTEKLSELEGEYRSAHSQLITNAEEIGFYDGANRERGIVSGIFDELYSHCSFFARQRAIIGIIDQYLIKYGASIVGYMIMCLPVFFPLASEQEAMENASGAARVGAYTRDFVRNRQLLIDLAGGVGLLLSTTNKVASLAGNTTRVSEVLDAVDELDRIGTRPFEIRADAIASDQAEQKEDDANAADPSSPSASSTPAVPLPNISQVEWLENWRKAGETWRAARVQQYNLGFQQQQQSVQNAQAGQLLPGEIIIFRNTTIVSPDGRLLVKDLNVEIGRNMNVMITGPNGCGKSSLFRTLGELWPVHSGVVYKPSKEDILFVPQKPYQVRGTLRDQIIYPHNRAQMEAAGVTDADLIYLLKLVDPANSILRQWTLDDQRNWFNAFSGGQKQRVAMARVFYHRPLYAILDECTSAVSEEVEGKIYNLCRQLGITLFTVSHRPNLQVYHDYQLRFDGFGGWEFLSSEQLKQKQIQQALSLQTQH